MNKTFDIFHVLILLLLPSLCLSSFNPDVRWSCSPSFVSIFVRTESPFEGLVTPISSSSPECQTVGSGTNLAVLRLPLQHSLCGVVYDHDSDTFSLSLSVHSHRNLIVEGDKSVNITCKGGINSSHSMSNGELMESEEYSLVLWEGDAAVHEAHYAESYSLRVIPLRGQIGWRVGRCTASDGGNDTFVLTDNRGCTERSSLLSDFAPSGTAQIPSMFRFRRSNHITFTCQIYICDVQPCEPVQCSDREVSSQLLEMTTTSEDSDAPHYTSTTVTILEKRELVSGDDVPSSHFTGSQAHCPLKADLELMYSIIIFLSVCSIVGFLLNIILCCLWRRGKKKSSRDVTGRLDRSTASARDFWIIDQAKPEGYYDDRRNTDIYGSLKKTHAGVLPVLPTAEYGMPASRTSETSSEYRVADAYRRPEQRLSNTTFLSQSATRETDLDSSASSNQASSYH